MFKNKEKIEFELQKEECNNLKHTPRWKKVARLLVWAIPILISLFSLSVSFSASEKSTRPYLWIEPEVFENAEYLQIASAEDETWSLITFKFNLANVGISPVKNLSFGDGFTISAAFLPDDITKAEAIYNPIFISPGSNITLEIPLGVPVPPEEVENFFNKGKSIKVRLDLEFESDKYFDRPYTTAIDFQIWKKVKPQVLGSTMD